MQSQNIILTQKQQLKLSPQMYQSLEILALPIQDLQARIHEEIERNPALELESPKDLSYESYAQDYDPQRFDPFENSSDPGYVRKATHIDPNSKQQFMEGALHRAESLQEHLTEQMRLQSISTQDFELGRLLISNLDSHGFHREPIEEILPEGITLDRAMQVLSLIQHFDPVGVGTSDFREALIVQCEDDMFDHSIAKQIISEHLELVRKGDAGKIAELLHADREYVEEEISFIHTLNPYPGSVFSSEEVQYVVPDLIIKTIEGRLQMRLNADQIPTLSIDPEFEHLSQEQLPHEDSATKKYLQRSMKDARWLISSIEMRNATLRKVGAALTRKQYDFFIKGPKYLRPLTLKDIAEEVSVHETTISRISNAKYVQTDFGIFPIKYFFTNAVSGKSDDGKAVSKTGVKEVMKELIEGYDGKKRLSDQKISDMLKERGISIARRTVAKYRKELHIDSSFHRD